MYNNSKTQRSMTLVRNSQDLIYWYNYHRYHIKSIKSPATVRWFNYFKGATPEPMVGNNFILISCETALMWMPRNTFKNWVSIGRGAGRLHAITRSNVDPDLYGHMASQAHNKLILATIVTAVYRQVWTVDFKGNDTGVDPVEQIAWFITSSPARYVWIKDPYLWSGKGA